MPRICTFLALLCALVPSSFATIFRGTLTQTVTGTNDPDRFVGETFVGFYTYVSPTIDGIFYTNNQGGTPLEPKPPGALDTLNGLMYQPFATTADSPWGPLWGSGGRFESILSTPHEGILTVSGGVVTDFSWYYEYGGKLMSMNKSEFFAHTFYDQGADPVPSTGGTVSFGAPSAVPDTSCTALLFGACVFVFCIGRFPRAGFGSRSR